MRRQAVGIIIGENEQELLIVTNNHVVDSTEQLYVQFIDRGNRRSAGKECQCFRRPLQSLQ